MVDLGNARVENKDGAMVINCDQFHTSAIKLAKTFSL